jgi:hypothetical protein
LSEPTPKESQQKLKELQQMNVSSNIIGLNKNYDATMPAEVAGIYDNKMLSVNYFPSGKPS